MKLYPILISIMIGSAGPLYTESYQGISTWVESCSSVLKIGGSDPGLAPLILASLSQNPSVQKRYIEVELDPQSNERLESTQQLATQGHVDYHFWRANDLCILPETHDMLLIDFSPTHDHLSYELNTFAQRVRKYICIKNATGSWGYRDDDLHCFRYQNYPSSFYRACQGPRLSVIDFLKGHPEWQLSSQGDYTILTRISSENLYETIEDARVDALLQNKMILCTGPSFGRYELLRQVVEADGGIIPFKKVFVATNDPRIVDITFKNSKSHCMLIANQSTQLDCTNCIIETLKAAANDPDVLDDDIIIFKHETVFVNDLHLIKQALCKLVEGHDMVARSWQVPRSRTKGTDAFFIKVSAVRKLLNSLNAITAFTPDGTFCEEYITTYIFSQVDLSYDVPFYHSNGWHTELGFYHIPSEAQATNCPWNKGNYDSLF